MSWCTFFRLVYPAIISGVFIFAFQKWFSHKYDKKLKKYEAQLDLIKKTNEIKFDALHHEMIDRICELFSLMSDEFKSMNNIFMAMMIQTPDERKVEMIESYYQKLLSLKSYLTECSIFLTTKVEERVNKILSLFEETLKELTSGTSQKTFNKMKESFERKYFRQIHSLRDEVKDILGVDIKEP